MNWIIPLDAIALLSILVASFFLWNSRFAKHYKEARFALFLLLILYFFQGTSSILERSGITSSLKVVKAYLGLMLPMVLFFAVYALLKEQSEIKLNMYRSLVSLNEDIIYFIDSNYLYCSVNEAFLSAHGKKHDEVIGCSVAEIVGKNTFESKLKAHFDLCLSGEMIKFQEVFNYSSLGLREMDVIFHPVRGKSDLITGVVVSCRDIAEHNLRELTLKDKEERFHTLFDGMTDGIAVCKAVEKGTDFVFKDINRAAQEMDGVLRDEVIGRKLTEVFPGVKKSGVLDVMCRVWKTGNTGNCIETHYNGDDIAFWRKNTVYKLPSGEVVAVYSDETLIRHSVEALRRSEKRYRTLVETMVHGVHEIDISGITVFANSAYHRILGYENGELIGRSMFFNQDPDVSNSLMEYIESRIQQKSKPKPWFGKACKKDGTLIDIQADWNYRLSDRSEITGFISIVTDISQRVKNERALKTEHSRFVAIMDSLEALVFVSDMDTHEILFANKKIRKQSGEVTGGVCWQNLRRGQTAPCSLCAIPLLLDANGKPEEPHIWEFMNPVENRWYQSSDQAISWPDGRIVHLGIATDITQRKLAEDALLVESQRLTNIIDGANAGTWQWNVQTGELTINDRWAELFGYSLSEISPVSIKTWSTHVHPDDLLKSNELLEKHFSHEAELYECEVRMKHKNGKWVWISDKGKVSKWTKDGKPLFMLGTRADISERKNTEMRLRKSKESAQALMNTTSGTALLIDLDGYVVTANQAAVAAEGISPEDAIGKCCFDYMPPEATRRRKEFLKTLAVEKKSMRLMDEERGRVFDTSIYPILDDRGEVKLAAIFTHDVTERVHAIEEIKKREKYLTGLNEATQILLVSENAIPFQEFLNRVGPVADASRCYLFLIPSGANEKIILNLKAEWCATGITPEIDNPLMQNLACDRRLPQLREVITSKKLVNCKVSEFPEKERKVLEALGIKSTLLIPIIVNGNIFGIIGFDNHSSLCKWDDPGQTFLVAAVNNLTQTIRRVHSEEIVRASLREKDVLLREIHHRVKNNMQVITSLLNLQAWRMTSGKALDAIRESQRRIGVISLVHEALYKTSNLSSISMDKYLKSVLNEISALHSGKNDNIQFQIDAQNLAFAIADAIPIGLIVSELVTNAIKHAFIKKQDGMIQISMQKSDELIKLVVSDNGSGIKEGVDMSGAKSLGLYIVDNLVKIQLRGEIEVSSGEGTKYTIKFPVPDSSHVISVVNR